jgi:hypothetical protein
MGPIRQKRATPFPNVNRGGDHMEPPATFWAYVAGGALLVLVTLSGVPEVIFKFPYVVSGAWVVMTVALYRRRERARVGLLALGAFSLLSTIIGFHHHPFGAGALALESIYTAQMMLLLTPSLSKYTSAHIG